MNTNCVLIIDDDVLLQRRLSSALAPDYAVHVASTGEDGLTEYERVHPAVVLLDVMLPQMSGMAVLRALKRLRADVPVIMMTGFAEVQTAVEAIRLGAADYMQKPIEPGALLRELADIMSRNACAHESVRANVIGESVSMARVWRLVERFGPTDIPILLQGETGTGKGLIAQAIHRLSKRAARPLVAIDCATIPEQLAESELFGYEDGAFTGAGRKKRGRVAFADRGTLFLDEIGTLALGTQSKLLTLVEQQNYLPLGARNVEPTHLDVRFISATNVPLQRAVEGGSFRADLYHRLTGVTIELPPLRERQGDVALLARHFIGQLGRTHGKPNLEITREALAMLAEYGWPGNVRELQRVLSVAVVLAGRAVTPDDLPDHVRTAGAAGGVDGNARAEPDSPGPSTAPGGAATADGPPLNLRDIKEWAGREAQKLVILELQKRTNITRQELARLLGVDPKTLRSRMKDLGPRS
jgi:DNA-binding NtrC family response regulator